MFSEGSYNRSKRVWNEEIVVGILFFLSNISWLIGLKLGGSMSLFSILLSLEYRVSATGWCEV